MKDLKERVVRGGLAKGAAQVVNLTVRVGSLMILARLLDPKDFGLVAMVTALTGVLNLFRDFGLATAAVQRTSITNQQVSTLFWINLLIGALLTCLAVVCAPLIADFYHEPRLRWVTVALAGTFLFNAAGVQHSALLQRQMRFTTLAAIDIGSLLASTAVGIGMAVLGLGYWALVGMTLTIPVVYSISVWLTSAWIPGLPHRKIGIRSMMQFGGTITLNSVVVYVAYNLEKVLLGRYWGADALGIYGRAYQLVSIPTDNLNSAVGEVAFSALSRIKDDPHRLKVYFLNGYALLVTVTLPITIACTLFADDLIFVVLGPKWSEAAPIFRLLAPTILIYAMINPMSWLMFSLGLVVRSLLIGLVLAPLVVTGYLLGLPYGPNGVAFGFSAVMILWVVPHIAWCVHGTVVSLKDIMLVVSRPLLSAIVAAAFAWSAVFAAAEFLSHLGRLLLGVPVLVVAYVGILFYVMRQKTYYMGLFQRLTRRSAGGQGSGVDIP